MTKIILLIVRYQYLKSTSGYFYYSKTDPPHKIMRQCVTQKVWAFDFYGRTRWSMICTTVLPVSKGHLGGASP